MEDARRGSRQPNHVHEGSMADRTESLGAAGTVVMGGGVQCTEHSILREHPTQWHLPWHLMTSRPPVAALETISWGAKVSYSLQPSAWAPGVGCGAPTTAPGQCWPLGALSQSELSLGPNSATGKV